MGMTILLIDRGGFGPRSILTTLLLLLALTAAAICQAQTQAQEILTTNRTTEIRSEPSDTATSLQSLPAQAKVQLIERKGAWSRVKADTADAKTGWVRMMHLRGSVIVEEAPQQTKSGGLLSGFNRLLGGNSQGNQRAQSATLGIRGLSPEELKTANPDAQQLAMMKSFAASKPDAERFAKEVPLKAVDVQDPAESNRGARR
jgi:hypothetical protein